MKEKLKSVYRSVFTDELRVLPANLAYSFTLAIIPILSLVIYFLTTLKLPSSILQTFLDQNVPNQMRELLTPVFTSDINFGSFITILFGIVVAANGCNAIIIASNSVYGFKNANILRRYTKAIILTIMIIILFAFILIVPLCGTYIIDLLAKYIPIFAKNEDTIKLIYGIAEVPISLIIMYFIIKLIYVIAPDENIKAKYVTVGSIFTTISWLLATYTLSYYLNNIAEYDRIYGNLANIAVLLFWFYVMAYIFVVGICINKDKFESGTQKTNKIKLDEIRKKIQEEKEDSEELSSENNKSKK